jgi:chloramphenicol-sensitive protein RarD
MQDSGKSRALIAAALSYVMWGLLPLYWKHLKDVSPQEILAHRIVWSFVFLFAVLKLRSSLSMVSPYLKKPRAVFPYFASSLFVLCNWGVYIYAVSTGRILQSSLGYFMAPLIHVLLGRIVLKEKLSPPQAAAIALMVVAVAILAIRVGEFPSIALLLALSFCLYGLARKLQKLPSLEGLWLETTLLSPFALGYLVWLEIMHQASFLTAGLSTSTLLILAGPVTALPLLLFALGAKGLPLKTLGVLQFISPTLQFLLAVLFYNETFTPAHLFSFGLIWVGLLIYLFEKRVMGWWTARRAVPTLTP